MLRFIAYPFITMVLGIEMRSTGRKKNI